MRGSEIPRILQLWDRYKKEMKDIMLRPVLRLLRSSQGILPWALSVLKSFAWCRRPSSTIYSTKTSSINIKMHQLHKCEKQRNPSSRSFWQKKSGKEDCRKSICMERFRNRFEKMVSSHKLEIWNYGTRERNRGGSIWVRARGQRLG